MLSTTSVQFLLLLSIKNLHMIFPYTDIIRDFICYYATLLCSYTYLDRLNSTIQQLQILPNYEVDRHLIPALRQYDKTSIATE
jgi:hypothetical protein